MHYKVVVVGEQDCGKQTPINAKIEEESNRWASQGYVLVTAYNQPVNYCGQSTCGAVLVFAKK